MNRFIVIFSIIILSSCSSVTNFKKDGLIAHAEYLNSSDVPLYYSIRINITESKKLDMKSVLVRFSETMPVFSLVEITPEIAEKHLPHYVPPKQWPNKLKQEAMQKHAYSTDGVYIEFISNSISYLSLCSHCEGKRASPAIGSTKEEKVYTLPITEQQLKSIFGNPENKYKTSEIYY